MTWRHAAVIPTLAVALAAGSAAADSPPLNVLFLTVDSLRADHVGALGYRRPTTPNLDAFARDEAVLFRDAFAASSWTTPGIVSALLGLQPAVHGMDGRRKVVDPFVRTPLRAIAERGYSVLGYLGTGEAFGNLGFEPTDLAGTFVVDHLREVDEPFFLWYQLKSPHLPYRHDRFREQFARPSSPPLPDPVRDLLTRRQLILAGEQAGWDPALRPAVEDLYDADVRHLDEELSWIFDLLRERGLWERTMIVIVADHGEELFDHGLVGHASTTRAGTLYDEVLHVPLLIRLPGVPGGRVVDGFVEQADLAPTVLEALGIEAPRPTQGRSLLSALRDGRPPRRDAVFAETTPCGWQCGSDREKTVRLKSVRTRDWKLVVRVDEAGGRSASLFDLAADPHEQRDVAAGRPRRVRRLTAALAAHEAENLRAAATLALGALDARRAALASKPPAERAAGAAADCDEITTLRYVYRLQNPSILDDPPTGRAFDRGVAEVLALLGDAAHGYWACRDLLPAG